MDYLGGIEFAAGIVTIVGPLLLLARWSVTKYKKTFGRRRNLAKQLAQLAPSMHLSYIDEQLGLPPFRRGDTECGLLESVWVDRYCFLHVFSDEKDGRVETISITTRDKRFRPTFMRDHTISDDGNTLQITLGRTMFTDLPGMPNEIVGTLGNRRWGYSEQFYFGNPGMYQTYIYSVNDGGYSPNMAFRLISAIPSGGALVAKGNEVPGALSDLGEARKFPINTFTVVAMHESYPHFDIAPGVDRDWVRVLTDIESRRLQWIEDDS